MKDRKKDYEYIAKLEKAICDKYGEETIKNPSSFWNEEKEEKYLQQLKELSKKENKQKDDKEKIEIEGFLVSKRLIIEDSSRECPICNIYSFNNKDDVYMSKYGCCCDCYQKYIQFSEYRWEEKLKEVLEEKQKIENYKKKTK